jgi:hypothetical protein
LVVSDHAERHVVAAAALDTARRALADRVAQTSSAAPLLTDAEWRLIDERPPPNYQ